MANETITTIENPEIPETPEYQQYINAIQELRNNTVSKELYNKVVQENNSLINTLTTGGTVVADGNLPKKKTSEECRQALWGKNPPKTQCEYVERALELRQAVLEETGEDCFVPKGHHLQPSPQAYESGERTARIYRECLDYANGDDEVFINELNRRMVDSPMANIINKRR